MKVLQAASGNEMSFPGDLQRLPGWDEPSIAGVSQLTPSASQSAAAASETAAAAMTGTADAKQTALSPSPVSASESSGKPSATSSPSAQPDKPSAAAGRPAVKKPVQVASASPQILIYHTHNRESYFPELKKGTKDASSKTINVTLVGKRLAASLEKLGIPTLHEVTDYPATVSKFNYAYSYKYSKQTVQEALSDNKDLKFLFDIHRDSQKRNKTTVEVNGKSYAKILFVIGERNPHWKENKAFAQKLHEALNAKYSGISRGVLSKGPGTGNAEYNQSLSRNSLVVEMGGVDNTLEENYRTADALAGVMNELFGDAASKVAKK